MPFDRFLIAPLQSGLQNNLRPWLIADSAYEELNNAYLFRGRVRKRFGGRLMGYGWSSANQAPNFSRFRILLGSTDGAGTLAGIAPGANFLPGQAFSIGTAMYTVPSLGTPVVMLQTVATPTATFNTTTGAYSFVGAPASTQVFFYPAKPVMGLCNYEVGDINNQPSFGFDTQFAYQFAGGSWGLSTGGVTPQWNGDNTNFFWTENWDGVTANSTVLFVTNFQAAIGTPSISDDPIWSYDGTTWAPFTPLFKVAGDFILTSRLIVAFKNRLLLLNTIEQNAAGSANSNYVARCRYSHNGSPFDASAYLEKNQAGFTGGGFLDATTEESIVSAEFIKDRLIVYFERSTWELAYTGNQILPFVWQKINTELGSESTFSTVPFDKHILTIGNTGVHACTGANVGRIDTLIPDEVFRIVDKQEGVARVAGVRDYFVEMVYWTFPSDTQPSTQVYPQRVLVYNYRDSTWSFNDDCITAFGYFEQQPSITWASLAGTTWAEWNAPWNTSSTEVQFRQVIAGNQEGFVFIVDSGIGRNAPVMQLTNLTYASGASSVATIVDHSLQEEDYVMIEYAQGITSANGKVYQVTGIIDTNTVTIDTGALVGTYTGGGFVTRVSNINIRTKQWNPYDKKGQNVYLARIDFAVQKTSQGQITVDYYPSSSAVSMLNDGKATNSIMGTGVLETSPYSPDYYPLEQHQDRLWHPIYFQASGECIQLNMYFSDSQVRDTGIAFSDFELEGLVLHTQATSSRLQ